MMVQRYWAGWRCWRYLGLVLLAGCDRNGVLHLDGQTQGTSYHVTVVRCAPAQDGEKLQVLVEQRLAAIDIALSNYRDDSELSRFNRAPVGDWIDLGPDLHALLRLAQQISRDSGGAFDVTVAPLLKIWGFGPGSTQPAVSDAAAIAAARANVGHELLELDATLPRARKLKPLQIDVNGIAQGYSVDRLADVLDCQGSSDYLVEIGGELRLAGHTPDGRLWHIGIEKPADGFAQAQQSLRATGVGVTTAGDYRDYFEKDGVRYSHTIDPRTGRPVAHKLAAVTVIAESAALADGYDTVLEVLGPDTGMAFAQAHHLAAYFIVREGAGFSVRVSPLMAPYLAAASKP